VVLVVDIQLLVSLINSKLFGSLELFLYAAATDAASIACVHIMHDFTKCHNQYGFPQLQKCNAPVAAERGHWLTRH